jgi:putative component of membrane protein insertase Oxa1/YidC/SpoIIIJ protein YidD
MTTFVLASLAFYQRVSRALIAARFPFFLYSGCRSVPTCSEYTISMIQQRGLLRGVILGGWHVLKCNPLVPMRST